MQSLDFKSSAPQRPKDPCPLEFGMRFVTLIILVNLMGSMGLVVFLADRLLRAVLLSLFETVLTVMELNPLLSQAALRGRQIIALHERHHP